MGHLAVPLPVGMGSAPGPTGRPAGVPDLVRSSSSFNSRPGITLNPMSSVTFPPAPPGVASEKLGSVEESSEITGTASGLSWGGTVSVAASAGMSSVVVIGAAVVIATPTGSSLSLTTSCHGHDKWSVVGITAVVGISV